MFGIEGKIRAVIVGARNGIGRQFVSMLSAHPEHRVIATSTDEGWTQIQPEADGISHMTLDLCSEESLSRFEAKLKEADFKPNLVLNCSGLLHGENLSPERSWRNLNRDDMTEVFAVNTIGVGLLIRTLIPLMPRKERAIFGSLSARVGSIGDNRLGGWYSYRASKAAQNMFLRCAALEAKRMWPELIVLALHPGTVDTDLSKPFSSRVPEHKLFSTEKSCGHLEEVIAQRTPRDTGGFFAWDGQPIIW